MHYKLDKITRGIIKDSGHQLPFREDSAVDRVVGLKRRAMQIGTGFWEWPLWRAYPTWDLFNKMLADEREQAAKERRQPHQAALPPKLNKYQEYQRRMYGELVGDREGRGLPPQKQIRKKAPAPVAVAATATCTA